MKTHVTFAEIEQTSIFKNLDKCYQNILKKKSSKDDINHGLTVYNSTGVIPSTVSGNNLKVLREIIKN